MSLSSLSWVYDCLLWALQRPVRFDRRLDIPTMLWWQPGKNSSLHRSWPPQMRVGSGKKTVEVTVFSGTLWHLKLHSLCSVEGDDSSETANWFWSRFWRSLRVWSRFSLWDQDKRWTQRKMRATDLLFITISHNVSFVGKCVILMLIWRQPTTIIIDKSADYLHY